MESTKSQAACDDKVSRMNNVNKSTTVLAQTIFCCVKEDKSKNKSNKQQANQNNVLQQYQCQTKSMPYYKLHRMAVD